MKIFPVYYFPPVSWFAAALHAGEIVLENWEHYKKQQYFNRMNILTPGKVLKLSIPVRKAKEYTPLVHRTISYDWTWRKDHWKSLESAYRSSPYFEYYENRFAPFFSGETESLSELNLLILEQLREALAIDLEWKMSDSFHGSAYYSVDYRQEFDSKRERWPSWFHPAPYQQVFGNEFVPDLSIFDLLCNCGPESVRILRESYVGK
ncbi:MAG TPA: hypothetical protein ENJ82_18275 [Bacteroidetes bacterium]|nr:hypothetical protein [Bacteroidota bacterium]